MRREYNSVDNRNYLTFLIASNGVIKWTKIGNLDIPLEYKKNNGAWQTITPDTGSSAPSISVVSGDKVFFRGTYRYTYNGTNSYCSFNGTTCQFNLSGNLLSLIDCDMGEQIGTQQSSFRRIFSGCTTLLNASGATLSGTTSLYKYTCAEMFAGCTSLKTPPVLEPTSLGESCYNGMFQGCTSLVRAPLLPATTLANYCYESMFSGCSSLINPPTLPASTLTVSCYYQMFRGCTSLTTAPALPATTLSGSCYYGMFQGCTSLATAPSLPATTMASQCYASMFEGCTSLTTAPSLPATILSASSINGSNCYYGMFRNCTSLTTAPALPATTLATNCYANMFNGCSNLVTAPPSLPATTLSPYCYNSMFYKCVKLKTAPPISGTYLPPYSCRDMFRSASTLNYIKLMAQDVSGSYCMRDWVLGVQTTSGTFVKRAQLSLSRGGSGIPNNWTIQDA